MPTLAQLNRFQPTIKDLQRQPVLDSCMMHLRGGLHWSCPAISIQTRIALIVAMLAKYHTFPRVRSIQNGYCSFKEWHTQTALSLSGAIAIDIYLMKATIQ